MSVTFHQRHSFPDLVGFAVECLDCEAREDFASYEEASSRYPTFRAAHVERCGDYCLCGPQWEPHQSVNLANSNAYALITLMGLDAGELVGECPAGEFTARAAAAAGRLAAGEVAVTDADYVGRTLARLVSLGEEAAARDRSVVWS